MTAQMRCGDGRDDFWRPLRKHWIGWVVAFVIVMVATALKDWWLTGDCAETRSFYLFVPAFQRGGHIADISRCWPCSFGGDRPYRAMLLIALALATIMQIVETALKIVWYKVWEYSGILWFGVTFGLYFLREHLCPASLGQAPLVAWG